MRVFEFLDFFELFPWSLGWHLLYFLFTTDVTTWSLGSNMGLSICEVEQNNKSIDKFQVLCSISNNSFGY